MKLLNTKLKGKRKAIFFDLEGTQLTQEIIAIGAVKAKLDNKGKILSYDKTGFKVLVKSRGKIGSIVTKLTKITESQLQKEGISYYEAMQKFKAYVGRKPNEYVYIAYGGFDKTLLYKTEVLNFNKLPEIIDPMTHNYFDFADFISKFMRNSTNQMPSLVDAIVLLNGKPCDNQHDPLCDTQNLLLLYNIVTTDKKYLKEAYKNYIIKANLPIPVSKILKKLTSGQNVTPVDFDQYLTDFFN